SSIWPVSGRTAGRSPRDRRPPVPGRRVTALARDREQPSLGPPPDPEALRDFPVWHVHAGTVLCRVTAAEHGPWWFSSTGEGRFDLVPPRGTCYLADDEVAALLE